MKKLCSLLILMIGLQCIQAQSNPELEKAMEKINGHIEKKKYDEAENKLEILLKDFPYYGKGWDLLADLKYYKYNRIKSTSSLFQGTVTMEDEDGNPMENDSLANMLMELLNNIDPAADEYNDYVYTLRRARLFSDDAYHSDIYLRTELVDAAIDANVSEKAVSYFNQAEEEFRNKNYNKAAQLYQKALDKEPNYYKAALYLGDSYYATEQYVKAIESFKKAKAAQPTQLEPVKYLCDAYFEEGLYQEALDEAIWSYNLYPGLSMGAKLSNAAYYLNKDLHIEWMPRQVFPNQIKESPYTPKKTSPLKHDDYWNFYVDAKEKIADKCNDKGIIESPTKLTESRYLEVYSWEEMLANSNNKALDEARRMQNLGYLDCYVFITCFHFDIIDQYRDFIKNNPNKVKAYLNYFLK